MPITKTNNTTLFLQADPIASLDLFIGQHRRGSTNWRDLYVKGVAVGVEDTNDLDLFIEGSAGISTDSVDLFIEGLPPTATLTLFVEGSGLTAITTLFVEGKSFGQRNDGPFEQDGFTPIEGSLDLFINRIDESAVITLYLEAQKEINDSLDLLVTGQALTTITDTITLFAEGLPAITSEIPLYVRGSL